jgi:hypothetical protein
MEHVREAWTDERLDDLNQKVDGVARRMDDGFRDLRSEMNSRFNSVDARFDSIQRTMLHGFIAIAAAMLTGFGGLAALIATQL